LFICAYCGVVVPYQTYKQNIEQRFGGHKNLPQHGIMIHAVSLGETLAAQPLVNALLKKLSTFSCHYY
jgi:3-deoxy-D-manno-octulosonic-acid transferase